MLHPQVEDIRGGSQGASQAAATPTTAAAATEQGEAWLGLVTHASTALQQTSLQEQVLAPANGYLPV